MAINLDAAGKEMAASELNWNWKDVALYNIGIGATELDYTYESRLKVLPTFAVCPPFQALANSVSVVNGNIMTLLHGEQRIEILNPKIPVNAETITTAKIGDKIYDKGKGATYSVETLTKTKDGQELFKNIFTLFLRGEGGWGGEKGPGPENEAPDREPDAIVEDQTLPNQNLVYRLSGDVNPLHIDPAFAALGGFDKPILHGLCTYGFVCRAVIKTFMDNDSEKLAAFQARFKKPVFPGQKIITKMWKEGDKKIIITAETEDGTQVLSNAAAELV